VENARFDGSDRNNARREIDRAIPQNGVTGEVEGLCLEIADLKRKGVLAEFRDRLALAMFRPHAVGVLRNGNVEGKLT
jgi:hypothetical protein